MPLSTSIPALVETLALLPALRAKGDSGPEWLHALSRILPKLEADKSLKELLRELEAHPADPEVRAAAQFALRRFLEKHGALDAEIARLLGPRNVPGHSGLGSVGMLDPADETLRRLEMVRLLRAGVPADQLARQFKIDAAAIFNLSAAFTLHGVLGLVSGTPARRWLDQLGPDDALLRRLEMVRLVRSGVPAELVAAEFQAAVEYVRLQVARFDRDGSIGVLTETEARRFRELRPKVLRLATYNLHGVHDQDERRYGDIARELAGFEPDLVAFQEVINGAGVRDTAGRLCEQMSAMAGADYRAFFAHCHLFQEKFPEGVSVAARHPFTSPQVIDLTNGLAHGVRPTMPRYAAALQTEIHGRTIAFASTHLDHASDPQVRAAQATKLTSELERLYPAAQVHVIAGDMNDVERSPAIARFEELGYVDAWRACHRTAGRTFPAAAPRSRIDFILVKGAAETLSAETALAHTSLSDHLGVFAVVR